MTPTPEVLLYIGILDCVLLILTLLIYRQVRIFLQEYSQMTGQQL